ncbi:hypothetical protein [Bradyrhizobium sp. USDA 4454]
MTDHLEDLIAKEARRQGHQPNQDAIRQAGIDLAGAAMTSQGLIHLPGRGAISPADFVRSLRSTMPAAFTPATDNKPTGNLTDEMRREVASNRRERALPADWLARRQNATGVTLEHMAERERDWR